VLGNRAGADGRELPIPRGALFVAQSVQTVGTRDLPHDAPLVSSSGRHAAAAGADGAVAARARLARLMSRDVVDASRAHLDYSSAKAQRELGWSHPSFAAMWPPIIRRERELMAGRRGFLNKLRHQPIVTD